MSWVSEFIDGASEAVSDVFTPIARELSRGDIGRFVGKQVTDTGKVLKTPFIVASDVARGDIAQAGKSLSAGAGSAINAGSMGGTYLAQDNKQAFKSAGKYTLGLTSDYADYASAAGSLSAERNLTSDEIWGSLRFGSKVGAAAYAVAYAQQISGAAKSAGAAGKDVALYGGAAKALAAGDPSKAAELISPGIGDTFNSYLPQIPPLSQDLTDLYNDFFNPSGTDGAPGNQNSYSTGPSGSPEAPKAAGMSPALIIAVIGFAGFFLMKRSRS